MRNRDNLSQHQRNIRRAMVTEAIARELEGVMPVEAAAIVADKIASSTTRALSLFERKRRIGQIPYYRRKNDTP